MLASPRRPMIHRWFLTAPHARRRTYGVEAEPYGLAHVRGPGDRRTLCGLRSGGWLLFWHRPVGPRRPVHHAEFRVCEACLATLDSEATSAPRIHEIQ